MTLVDAGPLIALIDKGQGEVHQRCLEAQKLLTGPLLTTWSCLTEAMYFLGDPRGWTGQNALWDFVLRGALLIHPHDLTEMARIRALMNQYKSVPMDLADASLVALAEARKINRIFTLDSDFRIYRINGKEAFDVIPS
jgi:predicted nucleic acid-binding protein